MSEDESDTESLRALLADALTNLAEEVDDDEEMEELTEKRDHLIDMFGPAYDRHWGWAAHELGDRPRFKDIEEAAGLEHHRPYHMYASKLNIHAGSKGTIHTQFYRRWSCVNDNFRPEMPLNACENGARCSTGGLL